MSKIDYFDIFDKHVQLNETRGVINRYSEKMSSNQSVVNVIYNYSRNEIIKNINLGIKNFSFIIPKEKYSISSGISVISQIYISYTPNKKSTKMSVQRLTNNSFCIHVYIDIFDKEFKSIFYHEFQHIFQQAKCSYHSVNADTERVINEFNMQNISKMDRIDIDIFQEMIYLYNPWEFNARKENVYNQVYIKMLNLLKIKTPNDVYKEALEEYMKDFHLVFNIKYLIDTSKDLLLPFIWSLVILNKIKFRNNIDAYCIFSNFVYMNDNTRKTIVKINQSVYPQNRANFHNFNLYKEIANGFDEFKKDKEYVDKVIRELTREVNKQKEFFIDKLKMGIKLAIQDAVANNKDEFLYEFLQITDKEKIAELNYFINGKRRIDVLNGDIVEADIFKKKYILDEYIKKYNLNLDINFGFEYLNERYEKWLQQNTGNKVNLVYFPIIQREEDIPDIIELINYW